jgi:hypothetical protein
MNSQVWVVVSHNRAAFVADTQEKAEDFKKVLMRLGLSDNEITVQELEVQQ